MLNIIIYTEEIWKPLNIDGIKHGLYEISNYGRVRNIQRQKILKSNSDVIKYNGKYGEVFKETYSRINLQCDSEDDKENRRWSIHRLVATIFIPNDDIKNKTDVNHLDGNKINNFVGNLEWATKKENIRHAVDNKLHWQFVGEKHPNSKYSNEFVLYIDSLLKNGLSSIEIYNDLMLSYPDYIDNVSRENMLRFIGRIKRRDRYKKILDNKSSTTIEKNID